MDVVQRSWKDNPVEAVVGALRSLVGTVVIQTGLVRNMTQRRYRAALSVLENLSANSVSRK